jgi:hypothetical protein
MKVKNFVNTSLIAIAIAVVFTVSAMAQVVVTPTNTQGWSTADTRPGGAVNYVSDAPNGGNGSLQLTTNALTTAKAQYMHAANTPLGSVTELSYYTKHVSAPFAGANASYQLPVCLGGFTTPTPTNPTGCVGFTTLVFEPYQNNGLAPPSPAIIPGVWQMWDVDAGQLWSSRTYSAGTCSVVAGFGGAPFYTVAGLASSCPNAVAVGFGVNIGSNNPSYDVYTDLVNFNGTTYDFELFAVATDRDQCKNGGWQTLFRANGTPFKNQGDCIQYVNTGR